MSNNEEEDIGTSVSEEERRQRRIDEANAVKTREVLERDRLALMPPNTLYSGGNGPNPLLGPTSEDDPCHNHTVTKPNDYSSSEISMTRQAAAVSQAINGGISPVETLTYTSFKTALREFASVAQVNDKEQ